MKTQTNYNPDVLSCLANLSNDEVFTPPSLVNQMLDTLPSELWKDKDAKFLDPVSKSGVFLREIARRLVDGLEDEIPDLQERIDHIYKNQLYGICITELTALLSRRSVYCSKTANGKYAIGRGFKDEQGNIIFNRTQHKWEGGKCVYCNASQTEYDRGDLLETHAYEFIHTDEPVKLFNNMKWDVIVGNPPYQLSDGGGSGTSARPIYQLFVNQAKKLQPRFLTMIIPSRWFAGGKGLQDFRAEMLNDDRVRKLVDFENASDVFPGVDIAGGVCYFLWNRDSRGSCEVVTTHEGEQVVTNRPLNEFDTFIRHGQAISIVRKATRIKENGDKKLNEVISVRRPFGIASNYIPTRKGVPCYFTQKIGLKFAKESDVTDENNLLSKWKLLIPFAPIAGQTDFSKPVGFYYDGNVRIAKPGECCSESWLVAGAFSTKAEVLSFKSYLFTKIVRFLLLQTVMSQNVTRQNFCYIPDLGKYKDEYTDEFLAQRWGITKDEWAFIDSKIK